MILYGIRLDHFEVLREKETAEVYYAHDALWIATGKEIYRYHDLSRIPELLFSLPSDEEDILMNSLMVRQGQTVVVGTSSKGIYCVDQAAHITRHIGVETVSPITEDRDGSIWVATRNRGFTRSETNGEPTHYRYDEVADNTINHGNVRHMTQANDSLLYVRTYAGLQTLDLSTGEFTDYEYDLNVETADIRSIVPTYYDTSGTLWLGTLYQGVQYYNVASDAYHFHRSSMAISGYLNSYIVSSIAEGRSGRIWFVGEGSGLSYYNKHAKHFFSLKYLYVQELSFKVAKSLCYGKEPDYLWVASLYQGIGRINLSTGHIESATESIDTPEGKTVSRIYNLAKMIEFASHDSLLIAVKSGLLVLGRKRLRLHHFEHPPSTSRHSPQVWDMTLDEEGDLRLITLFDLIQVNLEAGTSHGYPFFQITQSTTQHHTNHILCDKKGHVQLRPAGSGIYLFDKEEDTLVGYGAKQGLENGFIIGLVESLLDDSIYVATSDGFSGFSLTTTAFESYDRQSDFLLNSVNDGGPCITSDHDIYVCGLTGIVSIVQKKLSKQSVDYNVFVKRIFVNNIEIQPLGSLGLIKETVLYECQLVLPPRYSSVTFEVANDILNNISNIGPRYKLEGFDDEYIRAGDNTMVTYTNFHPGRYTFRVCGGQLHIHNQETSSANFELIVEVFIYQRAWFISLTILAGILVADYIIYMFRIWRTLQHSLLTREREKEYTEDVNRSKLRFFTDVSYEFRTPLTLIFDQPEILLIYKDVISEVYNKILEIYRNPRRMSNLVDEVIDIRKQDQGYLKLKISRESIVAVIGEICYSFHSYAQLNKIDLRFFPILKEADLYIDKAQTKKVFYNLLFDAFKYTKPGNWISVELVTEGENGTVILVNNLGVGVEKSEVKCVFERLWWGDSATTTRTVKGSGIGSVIAKGIVELHQGTIGVESEPDGIASFVVTLRRGANMDVEASSFTDGRVAGRYLVEP